MRPRTQKQPQVEKELCRVLDDVDVVLHGETLVFVTSAIVAEVESGSTFGETCLATEVQKVSRNQPCYTVQRLLKHVSQRRCTQVSAKSFNV